MASRTTIEINGKLYDAVTGEPLNVPKNTTKAKPETKPSLQNRRFIDGVQKPANKANHLKAPAKKSSAKPAATTVTAKTVSTAKTKKSSRTAAPSMKRQPKKSQTLHRRSVNRPEKKVAPPAAKNTEKKTKRESTPQIERKVDDSRLDKARSVQRSSSISRFATEEKKREVKKETPKRPVPQLHHHVTAAREVHHQQQIDKRHHGNMATRKAAKPKRRLAGAGTTVLVAILLVGYVTYLNVPSISMKVAGHRAGFAASLPKAPAGYSLNGPITSSSGLVTVDFKSNTDQRYFALRQQPSNWDSQALLENEVIKNHDDYVTYQDRGLTIYVYDGSNASWINGGKLFTLKSDNAQLTVDQILSIAGSM